MSVAGRKRKLKERDEQVDAQSEADAAATADQDLQPIEETTAKSHAALRKERKRSLKQVDANIDLTVAPKKEKDSKPRDPAPTRQNSVWVGNLAYKTTPDSLRKFFDGVGEITRIHMPTKNIGSGSKKFNVQGDNMGFAYVDFVTKDAKTIAVALSETNLDGRKLLIKDGDDFSGRPSAPKDLEQNPSAGTETKATTTQSGHSKFAQKVLKNQKQSPAPTLFMGNLPFEIVVQDIRSMLEVHRSSKTKRSEDTVGEPPAPGPDKWLKKIRLGTFEDSGKCKGWAFLDFADVSEATAALINPRNHKLNGRDLVLEYASLDAVRRGGQLPVKGSERPRKKPKTDKSMDSFQSESQPSGISNTRGQPQSNKAQAPQPERKPYERLGRDGKARPRPGAALAMAKRENVAIVESEGKKIKF